MSGTVLAARQRLKRQAVFLRAFGKVGTITHAAERAGINRATHVSWLGNESYALAFKHAELEARERLEAEARRRATEGVVKQVYHRGVVVGEIREYSDLLLIFLLNGAWPEKYRSRSEISGPGGAPLALTVYLPENGRGQVIDSAPPKALDSGALHNAGKDAIASPQQDAAIAALSTA